MGGKTAAQRKADLETIAQLRSDLSQGKNGAGVQQAQRYLMDKYGLDESAANSWQDVNYADQRAGKAGTGYRTLQELYAAL
jgi:hypothetical protein